MNAFALADELGRPSTGDAIVTMAWLGTRRQDWLAWPANIFDTQYLAWDTEKTNAPVTIPWSIVPALRQRIEAAKIRHQSAAITDRIIGPVWLRRCGGIGHRRIEFEE